MADQTSPSSTRRLALRRPEVRAATVAVAATAAVLVAAALLDPSGGLLAPVGGNGLPVVRFGAAFQWAPLLVGVPVLLAGVGLPVLLLARAGRPRVRAWWVLVVAWVGLAGAGALAAAATGFVAALPLVGAHLGVGDAARFALTTCGFAGAKLLLVGPVVGGAAALAYGRRTPDAPDAPAPATPRLTVGAVALMLVVGSFAAVTVAARTWRGGPLGYAFAGFLVAPTAAAGPFGALAGLAVLLLVVAVAVRAADRRLGAQRGAAEVAAAVWFASLAAGLALGVVQAVVSAVATPSLPDAGADSWWIATSLLALAAGLGYGVLAGLAGATVSALVWRARHRVPTGPHPTPRRVLVGAAAVLLVALPLVVGTAAPAASPRAAPTDADGALPRLELVPSDEAGEPPTIGDVTGRQVVLRGVNVNQLVDYYLRDPDVPANGPLTDDDFAQMAALGFDVVRLGMSWSRLEPVRGELDADYLAQVRTAVDQAAAHGLYTVLDMHEDAWGNALARPDQECAGGTTPTTGYDGAPAWATLTDDARHCQFLARDLSPATATAYTSFYADRDGIQQALVRTWAEVAREFADEPAVAGFDLLNEPGIGTVPPVSSGLLLGRYYDAAITAIRDAERSAGGFPHLVLFEPSVLWSGLGFDVTPPPGFTDDRQLVFAPHPYSESITMDQGFGLTIASIERNLTTSSRAAAAYGAALWAGEWGWFGDPTVDRAKVERFVAQLDRQRIGGAFWVWRQGCGAPETAQDAQTSGNLVQVDCATGELGPPPAGFAEPLSRAYPRAVPGRLRSVEPGADERTLTVRGTAGDGSCALDIWVPGADRPAVEADGVVNPQPEPVPGGWRVTGCAQGDWTVTVSG